MRLSQSDWFLIKKKECNHKIVLSICVYEKADVSVIFKFFRSDFVALVNHLRIVKRDNFFVINISESLSCRRQKKRISIKIILYVICEIMGINELNISDISFECYLWCLLFHFLFERLYKASSDWINRFLERKNFEPNPFFMLDVMFMI